jgi:putative lipoic acid-binding regulatory protein
MKRQESLGLLNAQHAFPGPFDFRVVVKTGAHVSVVSAIVAASGQGARLEDLTKRPSSKGTYEALVIRVRLNSAENVLDVFDLIQSLPEVVTAL